MRLLHAFSIRDAKETMQTLAEQIAARQPDLVGLRHDLHQHPELGFEETRTADIVARELAAAGLDVHRGLGLTGVVGTLVTDAAGPRIGLRADMDALAMAETAEDRPHRSLAPGRMHACGHDGHTVMLLAAARELARTRDFRGTAHFIFQPAEEGRGGARRMVDDGFFEQFPLDLVFGLHNMPGLAVDEIAVVEGPQLACSDRWRVTFRGEGTHGAKPHLGRDAVTAAAHFLTGLHTIVARRVDPLEPAVVSACAISGGNFEALNVIPDEVAVGGTARAYGAAVRDLIEVELGELAAHVARAFGVEAALRYSRGIPPVINAASATRLALNAARKVFAPGKVRVRFPPSTAGDDFAIFAERVPGAYVWLGNGPARDGALHHNSRYDFNDDAIAQGAAYWCALVREALPLTAASR
jgi:hippurate hydrolase